MRGPGPYSKYTLEVYNGQCKDRYKLAFDVQVEGEDVVDTCAGIFLADMASDAPNCSGKYFGIV